MSVSGKRASPFNVVASLKQYDLLKTLMAVAVWHIQLDPLGKCQVRFPDAVHTTACNETHDSKDVPMSSGRVEKPLVPENDSCQCQGG
jgi:hypothetical protein